MKGLRASIYTDASFGPVRVKRELTMFGRKHEVTLIGSGLPGCGSFPELLEPTFEAPAARLRVRQGLGREMIFYVSPDDDADEGGRARGASGPMFGGAFVYASDSRFSNALGGFNGAVKLHDHYEIPS